MPKKIVARLVFGLALAAAVVPINKMQGQSTGSPSDPGITTGGDPQPIKPSAIAITIISMVIAVAAG